MLPPQPLDLVSTIWPGWLQPGRLHCGPRPTGGPRPEAEICRQNDPSSRMFPAAPRRYTQSHHGSTITPSPIALPSMGLPGLLRISGSDHVAPCLSPRSIACHVRRRPPRPPEGRSRPGRRGRRAVRPRAFTNLMLRELDDLSRTSGAGACRAAHSRRDLPARHDAVHGRKRHG